MSDKVDLTSPEVTAAIEVAVAEAITGLKNKNTELLGELKAARKTAVIDPDEFSRLKEERDDLKDRITEFDKALKSAKLDTEKTLKLYNDELSRSTAMDIDSKLSAALSECKVRPELIKAAKAMFSGMAKSEVKDNVRQVTMDGKAVSDYVKEWAATDEGKHFVAAPANAGGGAPGGAGGDEKSSVTRAQFDGMSHVERSTFAIGGGKVVD